MTPDRSGELPLLDAAAARAGDEAAVGAGATWAGLMERAAGHLARAIVDVGGHGYGLRVTLVVGKGNNGGDGWAAARRLRDRGALPRVVAVHGLDAELSDEAADNRRRYLSTRGLAGGPGSLTEALAEADVAVDCLLGTGATGAPRGAVGAAVDALVAARERGTPVVACDVPTGVQADDGVVPGAAVRADLTVTFGRLKRGLLLHPGALHAGRVVVGELGAGYHPDPGTWSVLTARGARPPPFPRDVDKRTRGTVLVVAGSRGMAGAAVLTARGALDGGAGLVTVAVPRGIQDVVAARVPPALTVGLPEEEGAVAQAAAEELTGRAGEVDVVAAGPGLTPGSATRVVVDALRSAATRLVLDADALNVYRGDGGVLGEHRGDLILTPHVRELARIADAGEADTRERRVEVARRLAEGRRATVVAKGPGTVVAGPSGTVRVTPTGAAALATGGTGDVLTGLIAAAAAGADDVPLAVARACWWHGLAGQLAGADTADRACSEDVAAAVGRALAVTADLAERRPSWPFDAPGWHAGRLP